MTILDQALDLRQFLSHFCQCSIGRQLAALSYVHPTPGCCD